MIDRFTRRGALALLIALPAALQARDMTIDDFTGDAAALESLTSVLDRPDPAFNIATP